jgi:hypothetical protein
MSLMSKAAVIAAVAAVAVAGPTYAQSVNRGAGWSDTAPFTIGTSRAPTGVRLTQVAMRNVRHRAIARRESGVHAFAMVPAFGSDSVFSPALNGGGSIGYNENLRKDTW